jgi:hypothetical protein
MVYFRAAHEYAYTTGLYGRRGDEILVKVEKITL